MPLSLIYDSDITRMCTALCCKLHGLRTVPVRDGGGRGGGAGGLLTKSKAIYVGCLTELASWSLAIEISCRSLPSRTLPAPRDSIFISDISSKQRSKSCVKF